MTYFVNHLSLYSPKNRACKKLLDFISQFEHVLIKDDCSLDALSSLIEDRIREINTSHPKLRPICYSRNHSLQRITASVLPASGVPDYVFIMDFCQVRNIFQYSEKRLLFQVSAVFAGVLKMTLVTIRITEPAGGLMKSIHSVPIVQKKNRRRSANCSLCKYKGGWEMMALYIVLLGVFLAVILLCVLLSVHMAIEVEADYDDF